MLRGWWLCACVFLGSGLPAGAQSTVTLKGVDVYRSDAVTLEQIQEKAGPLLKSYIRLRGEARKSGVKPALKLKGLIEDKIRGLGDFAYVGLSYNRYATSAEESAYITFDLVEAKDAAQRMPFRPAPKEHLEDPDGLLAAWQQYSDLGTGLMRQGLISPERPSCSGFYCLWGSATPELGAIEARFVSGAGAKKEELIKVLRRDADPQKRAAAIFVLSYLKDGKAVADILLDALDDPAEEARAAALQVFSDIALYHKSVFVEINRIIPALDYPTVSDRSKALGVLVGLADNPTYRPYVMTRGTPYLLGLLKLKQPSNHDLAFTLLSMLSKESYDPHDYDSWEKWILAQQSTSTVTPAALPGKDGR